MTVWEALAQAWQALAPALGARVPELERPAWVAH